jgi:hypothetical protein
MRISKSTESIVMELKIWIHGDMDIMCIILSLNIGSILRAVPLT